MDSIKYKKWSNIKNCNIFRDYIKPLLLTNINNISNCNVELLDISITEIKEMFNVDILSNVKRKVYSLGTNKFLLCLKVFDKEFQPIACMPFIIEYKYYGDNDGYIWEKLGLTIEELIHESYVIDYSNYSSLFGTDYFSTRLISNIYRNEKRDELQTLINYSIKLSNTYFENEFFSSGFLYVSSIENYKSEFKKQIGNLLELRNPFCLSNQISPGKRDWYLVDGINNFYIIKKRNDSSKGVYCRHIFSLNNDSLQNRFNIHKILSTNDVLIRCLNRNSISIINYDGYEFSYIENQWKFRNVNVLRKYFFENGFNMDCFENLISFVLKMADNNQSSLIWLTNLNHDRLGEVIMNNNLLLNDSININDLNKSTLIERMLSSDGLTGFDYDGNLIVNFGIVNLNGKDAPGKKSGTGETAAKVLSSYGIAIKVSQDGLIKFFFPNEDGPLYY